MARSTGVRWLRAGALLAFVDFCWALVLQVAYGRPLMAVWNGVASVAFGPDMIKAGAMGVAIGLAMHLTVAFTWAGLFVLVESNFEPLRRWIATLRGEIAVAVVYGPFIWVMMSAIVIPTMTGNPLNITSRWFIQLVGHMVFVGMPVVIGARRGD